MSDTSGLAPAPLPRRLSSFVGRRAEIAELRRVLAGGRLVTLVGEGGCGKTRLALEVAGQVGPSFPDGVAFVELAPIQDPPLVPEAVAAALGIPRHAAGRVADLVGGARLLLVVDNAEHLAHGLGGQAPRRGLGTGVGTATDAVPPAPGRRCPLRAVRPASGASHAFQLRGRPDGAPGRRLRLFRIAARQR